jgi:hypothetical protein
MMQPEYYIFTGQRIPDHVTHVLIAKALTFVRAYAFEEHPHIEEVICHDGVEKIEQWAFYRCPRLRRVIMPGVKQVGRRAFSHCKALTYVECGNLEIIDGFAFDNCKSLRSIDLPSIKIIESYAFCGCTNLTSVNFGKDLETIRDWAFYGCPSLERISLPLKDGMITDDNIFRRCAELNHVDLIGGVHETIAALLVEEWKDDLNEEIDEISQILPNTPAGNIREVGGKTEAILTWITSVRRKYTHYKAEHRRYLNVAAAALQPALPNDIVLKNVLAFLELPSSEE